MRIDCEQCGAAYSIDDALITERGVRAQCPKCAHQKIVKKAAAGLNPLGPGPAPVTAVMTQQPSANPFATSSPVANPFAGPPSLSGPPGFGAAAPANPFAPPPVPPSLSSPPFPSSPFPSSSPSSSP